MRYTRSTPKSLVAFVGFISAASTLTAAKTVYTTNSSGSTQNQNLYTLKSDVFVRDEIAGTYYFEVTTPNGVLFPPDKASCRQLVVNGAEQASTAVSGGCAHAIGINGNAVQVIPFSDTTNP